MYIVTMTYDGTTLYYVSSDGAISRWHRDRNKATHLSAEQAERAADANDAQIQPA